MSVTALQRPATRRPLVIVAVLVAILGASLYISGAWRTAQVVRESIDQPLGAARSAEVTIAMAIGSLRIDAQSQPGSLIDGAIAYPEANRVERQAAMRGDTATLSLREHDSQRNNLIKYRDDDAIWDLHLTPSTPLRLAIEAGVGQNTLDLAQLKVAELDLKTGIGTTALTLPRQGQVQARVEGGVGNTIIRIPAGMAVRLTLDAGLGKVDVRGDYPRQGDHYISPDYDSAANRVELTASSGIGTISIQQIDE